MAAGLALLPITLVGCGKEEPPPPPPPAPRNTAPPPPPPPDQVRVADILREVDADARVQFPQEQAPYDRTLAEAVIVLAGSVAAGDDLAMAPVLDPAGRAVLDQLVASGEWYDATGEIEGVRVVFVSQSPDENTEASAAEVVLAVQDPGEAYVLAWNATNSGDGWRFSAEPSTGQTKARASEWDADTMAAFSPSAGDRGSVAAPLSMSEMLAEDPKIVFVAVEFSRQLLKVSGLDGLTNAMMAQMAAELGVSESRLTVLAEQGKDAVRGGDLPPPEIAGVFIFAAQAIAEGLGNEITDEQIVEALQEVLQVDETAAREYFEDTRP